MGVKDVLTNLSISKLDDKEINEESVAGEMKDIDVVVKALANKRGKEFMEQVEELEVITKHDDGVVIQISKITDDGVEKIGDFLTTSELEAVKVNKKNESNDKEVNEDVLNISRLSDYEKAIVLLNKIAEDAGYNTYKPGDKFETHDWKVDIREDIILIEFKIDGTVLDIRTDVEEVDTRDNKNVGEFLEEILRNYPDPTNEAVKPAYRNERVDRMYRFLDYMDAEQLLDDVVRALSNRDAEEAFVYMLRMWGDEWSLDLRDEIENNNFNRMEILDRILQSGIEDEKVLLEIVQGLSEDEAQETFDYIARMRNIDESLEGEVDEEDKSKAEKIIEEIKEKHKVDKSDTEIEEARVEGYVSAIGSKIKISIEDDNFELYSDILDDAGFDGTLKDNVSKVAEAVFEGIIRDYEQNASRYIEDAVRGLGNQLEK